MNDEIRRRAYTRDYDGWSFQQAVEVLSNAVVAPQTVFSAEHDLVSELRVKRQVFNGGVYNEDGLICALALHEGKIDLRNVPDPKAPPPTERLKGTWLFGGFYFRHIGHMLTESAGRLWGFTEEHTFAGIVFICWNGSQLETDPRTMTEWLESHAQAARRNRAMTSLLDLCGGVGAVKFVSAVTAVERLVVPSQLAGLIPYHSLMMAHPSHLAFIADRMSRLSAVEPRLRRIFISRSRFERTDAAFFMEDVLDQCFAEAGYSVIYPEQLSLQQQISVYQAADQVIMSAGSASHVLAMASKPGQEVALLMRYTNQNDQFSQQLIASGAAKVLFIDGLNGVFMPSTENDRERLKLHKSALVYSISFTGLWGKLMDAGFVDCIMPTWSTTFLARVREKCLDLQLRYGVPFSLFSNAR